jgi:chitinase
VTLGELKRIAEDNGIRLTVTKFGEFPYLTDGGTHVPFPELEDADTVPSEYVLYVVESFGLEGVDLDAYLA